MKVITYLGFTVLSIFIQFCVMDFIQEKIQNNLEYDNTTQQQRIVDALLKNISSKPHAIYYRTHMSRSLKKSAALDSFTERMFNNASVPRVPLGTTDVSATIFDILYDENTSTTTDTTPTTEKFFTTTEFDNITEITFFETKNKTSTKPNTQPKNNFSKYCGCNLLYKVCDVSCCCDPDCTSDELKYFQCEGKKVHTSLDTDGCITHLLHADLRYGSSTLDSMFCVVKTNLPEKRGIKKPNLAQIGHYNKWKNIPQRQKLYEFKKTLYKQVDPIWLLKNGTIYYLDFPTPMISSYCSDRAPITFLTVEMIQCLVKFNDLEMFHISKTAEESMVISAIESTINSTALNCSTLNCVNWTILACYNGACVNYDKNLNEASCTDNTCTNLALKVDYYFHYNQAKITNATIKLHMQNITDMLPFMSQEISVKFIMTNKSIDSVIEFSGNPGYISYLPIIVSNATSNFTDNFFNGTSNGSSLIYPENHHGLCMLSNFSHNVLRFGLNKRTKCRYVHEHPILTKNNTNVCKNIQDNINELLSLNRELHISPYGNPYGIKDEKWLELKIEVSNQEVVYGEYSENMAKLHCFNLINRVSIIFIFAKVDEKDFTDQNKILSAKYEVNAQNASFNIDDISTVLTVDINFIDATKPNLYVYAGSPHLNIHLPKDFFFPFPPNNCFRAPNSYIIVTIFCCVIFLTNKILVE